MCGACGQTVVADPVLGPERTIRQHLIVAQTVNEACRSWAGASKVAATSGGWLVSGPTGAIENVSTVEMLWTAVLRGATGARSLELPDISTGLPGTDSADISARVLALGHRLSQERASAWVNGAGPGSVP